MGADLLPVDIMEWMGMDESMAEFALDVADSVDGGPSHDDTGT